MDLYCYRCRGNHTFTARQAERIVYALTAALSVAETEAEQDRLYSGEDPFLRFSCPQVHLEMADSVEGYAEHVEASVHGRREVAGEARNSARTH
jgi:hypothetical protein